MRAFNFKSPQEEKEWTKLIQKQAREQMINTLLKDIIFDFRVCMIEGWDSKEYVTRLKTEIDNIYNKLIKKKI